MSRRYDYTSLGGMNRQFPSTQWTMFLDPKQRRFILAELCTKYWKPLYHYLRCKGFSNEEAKDLVQGFFTENVLGREFLERVDRMRGRFRILREAKPDLTFGFAGLPRYRNPEPRTIAPTRDRPYRPSRTPLCHPS